MCVDKGFEEKGAALDTGSEDCLKEINLKRKSPISIEELTKEYYFCTGLDLFIYQEPCIMCAMALSKLIPL